MVNFDPDRAEQLVTLLEKKEALLAGLWLVALTHEAELQACCQAPCDENCDHCGISYNDAVSALRQLLADAKTAPFSRAYGEIFPKFVCIASKALSQIKSLKESQDGNIGSEPRSEQSSAQDPSGS